MVKGLQRCASEGTDMCTDGIVKAKEMHVIDRGCREYSP